VYIDSREQKQKTRKNNGRFVERAQSYRSRNAATISLIAWMVRFEWADKYGFYHRNRFTGVVCYRTTECWFASER
jgi:hypothetical protein